MISRAVLVVCALIAVACAGGPGGPSARILNYEIAAQPGGGMVVVRGENEPAFGIVYAAPGVPLRAPGMASFNWSVWSGDAIYWAVQWDDGVVSTPQRVSRWDPPRKLSFVRPGPPPPKTPPPPTGGVEDSGRPRDD